MIIHPHLAALRSDDAPQRADQAALGAALVAWRASNEVEALGPELAAVGGGCELSDLPFLGTLFAPGSDAARTFASALIESLARALATAPLGQMPLRHFTDGTLSTLLLARHGGVTLSLQAIDGRGLARRPAPLSASFAPVETWEMVLAGSARAERLLLGEMPQDQAALRREPLLLQPGTLLHRQGAREALLLGAIDGTLVTLKLQRRAMDGAETREYALVDGRLLHRAAGSSRDSRLELAIALLGRMKRRDAAAVIAGLVREAGSAALRWQALRELIALDSASGFALLGELAAKPDDDLALPAGALRAQLLESYPQLRQLEPCPA